MSAHELKIWPQFFSDVENGTKPFDVRKADRPYAAGDTVHLREWEPQGKRYTGRECWKYVTHVYRDSVMTGGLEPGYVILGFALPLRPSREDRDDG